MRSHIVAESCITPVHGEDGQSILDIIGFPDAVQLAIKGYTSVKGRVPPQPVLLASPSYEPDYTDPLSYEREP